MKNNTTKFHVVYVTIIVILLAVIAGGFYMMHKRAEGMRNGMAMRPGMQMGAGKGMPPMGKMSMVPVTPPPLSDQQTQQLTDGQATTITKKTFNITGGNFYFVPNNITVNKGDQVTFVMTNAGGVHDLLIDELGVKTAVVHTGAAATATFTASKSGSFVYYCDISGHKAKGMFGTLIVQ